MLKLSLVSGRRTFFGRGNEIHYIGGTEILPAPLDTAEEQKMIHILKILGMKKQNYILITLKYLGKVQMEMVVD